VTGAAQPLADRPAFAPPRRRSAAAAAAPAAPLASIVVRTLPGRRGCVEQAAASVLAQTHARLELVIVEDGGSACAAWVDALPLRPGTQVVYQTLPKVGRSVAGNRGLEIARGTYAGFLDDDDRLYPDHVATLVEVLERRPDLAGAYTVADRVFARIASWTPFVCEEASRDVALREPFDRQELWIRNLFPIQALLFRRELFDEFGGFHPDLERNEDWDLWVRYSSRRDLLLVDRVTSMYRVPAERAERERRDAAHDDFLPPLRALQSRVPVEVSPDDLRSLAEKVLLRRKFYRAARALRCLDLDRELRRSRSVRAFLARDPDARGAIRSSPGEALELVDRLLVESRRLRLLAGMAEGIRRRPALKRLVDRCCALLLRGDGAR
jgi:glycosyltransferase involved in cell wall biosynthesis